VELGQTRVRDDAGAVGGQGRAEQSIAGHLEATWKQGPAELGRVARVGLIGRGEGKGEGGRGRREGEDEEK